MVLDEDPAHFEDLINEVNLRSSDGHDQQWETKEMMTTKTEAATTTKTMATKLTTVAMNQFSHAH